MDFKQISKEIQQGKFAAMYLLYGDEPYYIDSLTKLIASKALEEHERDFNQTVLYGKDVNLLALQSELRSYPMMAQRRLVILREAQDLKDYEPLVSYVSNPTETTVFVMCFKSEKMDSRKKFFKEFQKNGVVMKSEKIKDYQLEAWIRDYVKSMSYNISEKAVKLLEESIGNNLSRFVNEFEKLSSVVEKGTVINEVHIEENIGISREYNMFEFSNLLLKKDFEKAMRIIHYFEGNPKSWDLSPIVSMLFEQFSKLLSIHFLPNKSPEFAAQHLKIHPFVAKNLVAATHLYDPRKLAANIAILHEYDLKSKGVGSTGNIERSELLRELTFKLMY
jgi:DNA polymerase III subunit delta